MIKFLYRLFVPKTQKEKCADGQHENELKKEYPRSWAVEERWNVCKHCQNKRYLGTTINYD